MVKTATSPIPVALPSSGLAGRIGSSAIRDLLALTERPEILSLAGGMPSPAGFPVEAIADASAAALAEDGGAALQYATTEGHLPLREWIADRQPVPTSIDGVIVTSGSQQAIELLARAILGPGDTVVLGEPGYVGAIQAFRSAGARLVGLPVDGGGLRVDVLADRLDHGLRPRLVYVVANFDNPTGATLRPERRAALAGLADRHGFVVVDDDPYGELRWRDSAPRPLAELTDRVVTLGSTSKVLCPGLRVGWAVAAPELVGELVVIKQAADLHSSSLSQRIAHRVLSRPGFLGPHIEGLRVRYRRQADALAGALRREAGDHLTFDDPDGGMFLWARLTGDVDPTPLLAVALDHGVAFVPGSAFAVAGPHEHRDRIRLSFATGEPDELAEAATRLAAAITAVADPNVG
jgi:2-aminoadipate transaminase